MKRIFPETDIYGILDFGLSRGRSNVEVAQKMVEAGIKIIQYREKDRKMGVMLEECKAIRELTRKAGVTFIVNDFSDIALLVDADGVHVGQDDLPVKEVRKLLGPDKIIGLSTHSPEQAENAVKSGADYIGVGPVYATSTKKDVVDPVGLEYVDYALNYVRIPFVAIGGIKAANIGVLASRGVKCCCVVSGIVAENDIPAAVAELRKNMQTAAQS